MTALVALHAKYRIQLLVEVRGPRCGEVMGAGPIRLLT